MSNSAFTGNGGGGAGGTVSTINTGVGLTGGPITNAGTIAMANTAVTPGSYTNAVITVDAQGRLTSAASGPADASVSISTTSLVGLTEVAFVNLSSDYIQYQLMFANVSVSINGADLSIRFSNDNGATYINANYAWSFATLPFEPAPTWGTNGSTSDTDIPICDGISNVNSFSATLEVFDPMSNGYPRTINNLNHESSTFTNNLNLVGGVLKQVGPMNGMKVFLSAGTFLGGSLKLIGVRRAT